MAGAVDELSSLWSKNGSLESNVTLPYKNITLAATTPLLDVIHFNYAWFLGLVFLVAFIADSFLSAQPATKSQEPVLLGPGGKPLPPSARKNKEERERNKLKDFGSGRQQVFNYLSVALLLTFVAHGFNIVVHALVAEEGWWCGEATAVSGHQSRFLH